MNQILNTGNDPEELFVDKLIANARKIAEKECPLTTDDAFTKEVWITGYISGYLRSKTEQLKSEQHG